eukprot:992948-Rhodomonas_salina.1
MCLCVACWPRNARSGSRWSSRRVRRPRRKVGIRAEAWGRRARRVGTRSRHVSQTSNVNAERRRVREGGVS